METIRIQTAQNITIDYEIGGLGERIVALVIDYVIFIPFAVLGIFIKVFIPSIALAVYFIALGVFFFLYNLLCEIFFNGQSLGKRVMKIRVISLDGGRPRFSQYLMRWLFRFVDFAATGGLVALISAIITEKGQRVGDIVAGTVLIRTEPRTTSQKIVFQPLDETYIPTYSEVSQLQDKDIGLIYDVVNAYYKTGDLTMVNKMSKRIKEHLRIEIQGENDLEFLNTVTRDYTHITAQESML